MAKFQTFIQEPGSGGGISGVVIQDEGTPLGTFTTLDFVGGSVSAVDAGGGKATITISGSVDFDTILTSRNTGQVLVSRNSGNVLVQG